MDLFAIYKCYYFSLNSNTSECERKLGKKEFEAAYQYLKKARFGDESGTRTVDENRIMKDLKKIVSNPSDCFTIDQLLFLEEQEKLAKR